MEIRDVLFLPTPGDWRDWLAEHHATRTEQWVGFYRKGSGRPSMTWAQAVDEALCYGWIDGIRKRVDETSYANRFTPRKRTSNWSAVNIARVEALMAEGRMETPGLAAFEARAAAKSSVYSYEQRREAAFTPEMVALFQAHATGWAFFEAQPPSYRTMSTWWVMSAKREETRQRRLAKLIEDSGNGQRLQ